MENAGIWIEIAQDGRCAWLNNLDGVILNPKDIEIDLKNCGVVKGVNHENLQKACKGVKLSRSEHIADFIPPTVGEEAYLTYLVVHEVKPVIREDGTIDFREINLIKNVHVDEPLVRKTPPTIGEPGFTVTGREIPGKRGKDLNLKMFAGSGTGISDKDPDLIVALRPGAYRKARDGKVYILDLFAIKTDVSYATGNIHSTSSVHIDGDVKSGFAIECSGDVAINGLIENASVNVEGDLKVKLGVTQGFAPIIVAGDMEALYIYNRAIVRAQDVSIAEMISNTKLYSLGSVTAKRIHGGEITAKDDILVEQAGSPRSESNTLLVAGVDPKKREYRDKLAAELAEKRKKLAAFQKELDELNHWAIKFEQQSGDVFHELTRIENSKIGKQIKENIQNKLSKLSECRKGIEELTEYIQKTSAEVSSLSKELANPKSTITVTGTVFAGVSIVIGESAPLDIDKSLKKVKFQLDGEGHISIVPLR